MNSNCKIFVAPVGNGNKYQTTIYVMAIAPRIGAQLVIDHQLPLRLSTGEPITWHIADGTMVSIEASVYTPLFPSEAQVMAWTDELSRILNDPTDRLLRLREDISLLQRVGLIEVSNGNK